MLFEEGGANPALDLLKITALILIPFSLVSPLAGVAIDRIDRRKILVWTPAARAIGAISIPIFALTTGPWFLLIVLVVLSMNRLFLATLGAVLPQLVPEEDLLVANSTSSTSGAVANVIGHAIGSLVAEGFGGRGTAAVSSIAFLGASGIGKDLQVERGLQETPAPFFAEVRRVIREMVEGFNAMRSHRRVRFGMASINAMQVLVGGMVGVLIHYLVGELGLGPASGFAMLALLAVGVGAGVLLVPLVAKAVGNDRVIPFAFISGALGTAIPAIWLNRPVLAFSAGFVGLAYALVKIPVDTLVQEEISDHVRGRAFSLYDMVFNLSRLVGTAAVAIAYEFGATSRALVFVLSATFLIVMRWTATSLRRLEDSEPAVSREPTSLALRQGDMVGLRANEGNRIETDPSHILVSGSAVSISRILWRGVTDDARGHAVILVVEADGQKLRLRLKEGYCEVERLLG